MRDRLNSKINGWMICAFFGLAALYFIFVYFHMDYGFNRYNFIIFLCSLGLFLSGVSLIPKRGITMCSAMLITFYGALAINNLNISSHQLEKNGMDLYFYFLGPLLMIGVFYLFESDLPVYKIKSTINSRQFSAEQAVKLLLILYWAGNLFVVACMGARVFRRSSWMSGTGSQFKIGGVSGLVDMMMWLLLMLFPEVKRGWKIIIIGSVFLFWCVFNVSRSNMIVLFMFLLVYYARKNGRKILSAKSLSKITLMLVFIGVGFAQFGNFRQKMRGWENIEHAIINILGFRIDNSILAWLYGYSVINFDVVKMEFFKILPRYRFDTILLPFMRYIHGSSFLEKYNSALRVRGINGMNASTILGPLVHDLGCLYFVEMGLYAVILGVLARGYLRRGIEGGYLLLITWSALMLYGNFFMLPNYFLSAVLGLFVLTYVNQRQDKTGNSITRWKE